MSRLKTGFMAAILIVAMLAAMIPPLRQPKPVGADSGIVSPDGWGWQNPLPQPNPLTGGIWCSSASDMFAVG